jgi:Xaa-Pro dipeptidase
MQEKVKKKAAQPEHPKGDLDPQWAWGRHLPAWGAMGVDFESRVEFDRMRRYRIARARQALENSDLGALLLFDVNNIRYVSATKIGEWERDKLARFALLAKVLEPIVWDFGSAAVHLQLYSHWLLKEHC